MQENQVEDEKVVDLCFRNCKILKRKFRTLHWENFLKK